VHRDLEPRLHPAQCKPDGTFSPLPASMSIPAWARACHLDHSGHAWLHRLRQRENLELRDDIFLPIFGEIEKLSCKKYGSTCLLGSDSSKRELKRRKFRQQLMTPRRKTSHFVLWLTIYGTVSFAIADSVEPGNGKREYVVRRVLRRAARYGARLASAHRSSTNSSMCSPTRWATSFPNPRQERHVQEVIRIEEEAFNKTLDKGIALFEEAAAKPVGERAARRSRPRPRGRPRRV